MKAKFSLTGVLLALASTAPVSAVSSFVTVDLNDGTKCSYLLSESPKISYSNDSLFVSGPANAAFKLSDVDAYYFTESDLSKNPLLGSDEIRISYLDNRHVKVEGLQPNSPVVLYATNGVIVKQTNANNAGVAEIELPQVKGIYVLKTNTQTVKLVKE